MKVDGIELLAMARDKKLKSRTILKTKHESECFSDFKKYDYYIYFEDNQFHRCDENGKLGAKYQNRFLNYEVLRKEFEIIEEDKEIEEMNQAAITLGHCRDKINELIREVNKLKKESK